MDIKVNYAVVGAFVIVLFATIIFSIIWLSAGITVTRYTNYAVYMSESVSGLNVDSPVEYNGVNIGNVLSINIDKTNPHLVDLVLQIKVGTPITKGTTATLKSRGITGTAYIGLLDNGNNMDPLKAEHGETYPVIKTAPSLLLRLDTILSDLASNLSGVTQAIKNVLSPANQTAIRDTLNNLNKITATISDNNEHLQAVLQNTSNSMKLFEQQTIPAANDAMMHLGVVMRDLSGLTEELKENPSMLIRGKDQANLGPGE